MPVFSFLGDGLGCSGFRFGWVGFGLVLAWFELVRVVLDSFFVHRKEHGRFLFACVWLGHFFFESGPVRPGFFCAIVPSS